MADLFRRIKDKMLGGGGAKCDCCNPFFGKDRKKLNRIARSIMKEVTREELMTSLSDFEEKNGITTERDDMGNYPSEGSGHEMD